MSIDLSIIIVSWNVRDLLRDCLRSVADNAHGLQLQVIVVDSHSADDTADVVRDEFSWVELIACDENVGFPRGNNIGLQRATGRYILLLNPDTVVLGTALLDMVAYLDAHPTVGVIGPQLRYPDGAIQSSRRRFPSLLTGFFESTWLDTLAPAGLLADYYVLDRPDDAISAVDWVMGACLMTRKPIVDAVGGMDEDYFMYSEEIDWCRRIKMHGWDVVYLPIAKIVHYEGKSSEQAVTHRHVNFNRAKLRYFYKYHGMSAGLALRLFLLSIYVWQFSVELVKYIVGHRRRLRFQRMGVYWQVLKSGLSPAGG